MTRWLILVLALCVAPSGCAGIHASRYSDAPLSVRLVHENLKDLHGETVFVRGIVTLCYNLTCWICDEIGPTAACMSLNFAPDTSEAASSWLDALYRYADITVEATIDATCELGYNPDAPPADYIVICTDRGSGLENSRVVRVWHRYAATDMVLGDEDDPDRLRVVEGPLRDSVLAAWRSFDRTMGTDGPQAVVLASDLANEDITLCVCREGDCEGRWPTLPRHLLDGLGDPYYCYSVFRSDQGWIFRP